MSSDMRFVGWLAVATLLAGCSGGGPSTSGAATSSPSSVPAVLDLLDCDGPPSAMGGIGPFGVVTLGDTPEAALASWLEAPVFVVPVNNWAPYRTAGDRTVFVYRSADRIKVAAVFSAERTEVGEGIFTLVELRACEEREFGPDAVFTDDDRVWANEAGAILREQGGPAHCGWEEVRFLRIPEGAVSHQYIGDPLGIMPPAALDEPYDGDATLPADATASGYRNGDLELWFVPDGRAVFVVGSDRVELWPRSGVGCA
jgi:hypothetical protein